MATSPVLVRRASVKLHYLRRITCVGKVGSEIKENRGKKTPRSRFPGNYKKKHGVKEGKVVL